MNNLHPIMQEALRPWLQPRFPSTYCSQCGVEFGPGNHGFSACHEHKPQGAINPAWSNHCAQSDKPQETQT